MKQNSIDEITIKSSGEINPKTGTNTRIPYEHQKNAMACLDIINKEKAYSTLVVLPTGGGKTYTASMWLLKNAIDRKKKILWIAHRQMLLEQAAESFQKFAYAEVIPHISSFHFRIVSGASSHERTIHIHPTDQLLIVSKDSIGRNLQRLDAWMAGEDEIYMIVDEAHHSTANAENSTKYNRKYTDQTMIPMRNEADTRVGGNYYLVEIYGYYVEGNGTPKQYYKSAHNFIAGDNATANECFLMEANVKEKAQEYFDIAATTDGRGSITPSGTVSVKKGENQTFTVTPNSGYEIEDVLVDGNSVGVVKSYTFENVTANHTIHATFKEKEESGGGSSSGGSHTSNTYYVRYHNDDDIVKDGRFIPGETVTVRGDIFTAPRGKVLAGWSLEENGKVDYKAGDTFRMPGGSYDLYAVWKDAETMTHTAYIYQRLS